MPCASSTFPVWNWLSFSPLSSSILKGFGKVVNKNRSFRGSGTQVYQFVWNKNKGSLRAIERDQVWVLHRASSMWGARSMASALMFKEFNQSMVDCQCGAGFRCTAKWTIDTHMCMCECALSRSVVSDSLWPHGLYCSLPGFSVHGISQARILEWVAISYSRGTFQPRYRTHVSCALCIGRQITSESSGKPTHTHTHTHTHPVQSSRVLPWLVVNLTDFFPLVD